MKNESKTSVEHWSGDISVGMHCHEYYELTIIEHGSCKHIYNNAETFLIPGDVVLLPPHSAHGFSFHGTISMYTCQFFIEDLEDVMIQLILTGGMLCANDHSLSKTAILSELFIHREMLLGNFVPSYEMNSNKQGLFIYLQQNMHLCYHKALFPRTGATR